MSSTRPPTPTLVLRADTGISNTDRITRNNRIDVVGIVTGATWQYSIDSGRRWFEGGRGNSFTVPKGKYSRGQVQVKQTVSQIVSRPYTIFPRFEVDFDVTIPTMTLVDDTGNPTDRVTINGLIRVGDIEAGARWQYSTNGGVTWTNGIGRSFVVGVDDYNRSRVQVRQIDRAGNVSSPNRTFQRFQVISSDIRNIVPTFVEETVLPNGALGSDADRGWTCTGLSYDATLNLFWVGNLGQAKKEGTCVGDSTSPTCVRATEVPSDPSIIAMPLDGKLIKMQLRLKDIYPDATSIQGITIDTTGPRSLWFVDNLKGRIHNITIPEVPLNSTEVPLNSTTARALHIRTLNTLNPDGSIIPNTPTNPNGLAYDPNSDELIVLHRTRNESNPVGITTNTDNYTISRINKISGQVNSGYETGFAPGADQLFFDPVSNYLFLSWGDDPGGPSTDQRVKNPSTISIFDHKTGRYIGRIRPFDKVYAAEGISILPTPNTSGRSTIYFLSDNYWENFEVVPLGDRKNRMVSYTIDTVR